MHKELKRITVKPDSELGVLIKDAATPHASFLVTIDGVAYFIDVEIVGSEETEVVSGAARRVPDPDEVARSQEGIRQAAGGWKDIVDAEEFKAYIANRRRTSSRPRVEL